MLQPDLISQFAETSEYDLDDLARLTSEHYQKLISGGLPADLAGHLARDLHLTWLAAIYGESTLRENSPLVASLSTHRFSVVPA